MTWTDFLTRLAAILYAIYGIYLLARAILASVPFLTESRNKSWHILLTGLWCFLQTALIFGGIVFHIHYHYPLESAIAALIILAIGASGITFLIEDSKARRRQLKESKKRSRFIF